ncbi:MAG: ABC transporter substrate-binding protein [Verrucomicrobiota bacterium]
MILFIAACSDKEDPSSLQNELAGRQAMSDQERFDLLADAFPWERIVSNSYLLREPNPSPSAPSSESAATQKLIVALPWLPNDQTPALWLGLSRGYFAAEGLDLEIVPGGPGRDNLLFLLSGKVDLTIASNATGIIRVLASKTGGELVAVGSLQKEYPYAYIALDKSIPSDQPSSRTPTRDDFRGKVLGMTPGGESFLAFALDSLQLDSSEIEIRKAGSSLVPLTEGVFDFYTTMADNNPRKLEAMGHHNWMLWRFSDHGWIDYHNVIVTRPNFLESNPELVRSFLRALDRSARALLDEETIEVAKEILPFVADTGLDATMIARRLELQRPLTLATDDEPLLHTTKDKWIEAAAMLWRLGVIEVPNGD